ncbi:MAG: xylulokinase [Pseudomonadota bacterium]
MLLGIDVGTSGVKLSLVSPEMREVASASSPLAVSTPEPYWSEQNPDDWRTATAQAVAALSESADLSTVRAIGLSGQMHGAVLLDAEHKPLRPAILWNDGRSYAECEELSRRSPDVGIIAGAPPLPGFTAPKIMWLKRAEPAVYDRIAAVLLPKDYVGRWLHGELVTDKSDAAGTLWFDQAARGWSPSLCAATDTDIAWLPRCVEGVETAGTLTAAAASELGLPPGIPVVAGGGDAATGAVGVGAVDEGAGFLSLGTSGQIFVASASYRPNPAQVIHAYAHAVPGMWYQMAAMLNGARPMAWFANVAKAPIEQLLAEAEAIDPASAPLFLPYLTGERSPLGDAHIRGAFYGLADDTDRASMMRGVINAIAFSFANAATGLRDNLPGSLPAIGGGAQSDLLLQTLASALGIGVERAEGAVTGPAFGAAKLAGRAVGAFSDADLEQPVATSKSFEPTPWEGQDEAMRRFSELYTVLKPLAARAG